MTQTMTALVKAASTAGTNGINDSRRITSLLPRRCLESGPVASSLLSGGFRSGLGGSRGRLLRRHLLRPRRRFLDRRSLLRRLFGGRPFGSGFLVYRPFCFRSIRTLCCPGRSCFRQIRHQCGLPCFAQFSLRFRRGWCWRRRLSPDLRPPTLLGFLHPFSSGSGEFAAFAGGHFRRGGGFGGATS